MKSAFSALVAFLFTLSAAFGGGGDIVAVAGTIKAIDTDKNTISIDFEDYQVNASSVMIVNGSRGGIKDLTVGMKVEGSIETPHFGASGRSRAQTGSAPSDMKTIRMINAKTDPSYVAPPPVPPASQSPGAAAPAPIQEWTPPQARIPAEAQAAATQKFAGTFWLITHTTNYPRPVTTNRPGMPPGYGGNPYARTKQQQQQQQQQPQGFQQTQTEWFCLNTDGSVTSERNVGTHGKWAVVADLEIAVSFNGMGDSGTTIVQFNPELTEGSIPDTNAGPMNARPIMRPQFQPNPMMQQQGTVTTSTKVTAINRPTRDMLAKVPAPAAPPAPPVSAEAQGLAADIIKNYHDSLVFVTGNDGAGSGFIATMSGTNYLVTNAHVAAGINNADFKTLAGAVVKGGTSSVAVGHDILRMAFPNGAGKPFEVMQGVEQQASIGDEVVVLGNAQGSGVINTILGKIVGIGPNLVEIDAPFVPGNSGSPIVHLKSGKVIGVATYTLTKKYDTTARLKMVAPVVRHFGYRLDSVAVWQPVNWQLFYNEAAALERIRTLTKDLDAFFEDISESGGKVNPSRHTNPTIRTRITQWQDAKSKHLSDFDRQNADANFISFLKVSCQADITAIQGRLAYDYFQRQLTMETGTRTEMSKAFESIIRDIRE